MRGPSDQVKLLFFGLLRTASALASRSNSAVNSASSSGCLDHSHHAFGLPPITLRLARRSDVPSIQQCNLATLPENYNQQFYANHLRQWPDLAIVACVEDGPSRSPRQSFFRPPGSSGIIGDEANDRVVAYVLGKVEERPVYRPFDPNDPFGASSPNRYETERFGHVTSLAVLEPFRRQGLAYDLMKQLHHHLEHSYDAVQQVGLHVRQSNRAACRLYEQFGYEATEIIARYYQDGEDAYYMTKRLAASYHPEHYRSVGYHPSLNRRWSLRRQRPWEMQGYQLPRLTGDSLRGPNNIGGEDSSSAPELLTGTM